MSRKDSIFGAEPDRLRQLIRSGMDVDDVDGQENPPSNGRVGGLMERPGTRIGCYKLLRVMGEGGMGIVYLAEQEQLIRRRVALKIIKPGMDSKRVLARFEAERQALALLDHSNIAQVYDAGTADSGRPYFVMEYVKGMTITEFCDYHTLNIEQRLRLFQQVCGALQHAHQKGIIHRDIKPSNILVSSENDQPIPKIIDFGVAKAISQPLTERTLITEESQLLGTPEYMSPEQVEIANEDIDTRSDIYSLGVLLYVLLSGVLPFDSDTLRTGGIEHVRKVIRETDPKTPSTRLTKLGQEAEKVAENRRTEVATLAKCLHRELEWIPLKAMRKERSERYRSASELADDIDNYLNGLPLVAGPLTTIYRLKKLVRRHKSLAASLIAVFAILTAGIIVSSVFALKAQRRAQGLVSFVDFLTVDVLGSARDIKGWDTTVIDLLDAASVKLDEGAFKDQPFTAESLLRFRLGNLIKDLGYPNKAIPHLERVREIYLQHGVTPPPTGRAEAGESHHLIMNYLALAYLRAGEYEKAEKLFQQIVEEKEQTNHYTGLYPWVKARLAEVYRMQARYEESERILREMMDPQFRNGEGISPDYMVSCMRDLAETYRGQGRYEDAEQMHTKVQRRGSQEPPNLPAMLYLDMGCYPEAEERLRTRIERIQHGSPGTEPMSSFRAKNDLAVVLTKQSHFDEAERLFAEVLKVRRERGFDDHPDTLETINAFGVLRREQKRYEEAESLLKQALDGRRRKLGADHFTCFESMHELGVLYKEQERYEEAEKYLRDAVEGRRLKLGDTHPDTIESTENIIDLYEASGKPEKAEEWRTKLPQTEDARK